MKSEQVGRRMNNRHHRSWVLLSLIVAAAFAVRVGALAYWQTGAIENEGAEYARLAENLRNGAGFVGIAMPGTQLSFNPLFPLLIAAASFVTGNYEWAARLVSLVLGALLPLPVFGIASRLFNRRVGLIAALLTVLHPLLVNLSFTALSEGPYITLLMSAVYVGVRALNHSSIKMWSLVGAAFGLAYLLRAEAVALFLIAVVFAFTATKGGTAVKCKLAVAAIGVFLVLALPEVILIYRSTGKVLLEGKSTMFFAVEHPYLIRRKEFEVDHKFPDGQQDEFGLRVKRRIVLVATVQLGALCCRHKSQGNRSRYAHQRRSDPGNTNDAPRSLASSERPYAEKNGRE